MRVVFMGSSDVSGTMLDALVKASGISVVGVITQPDKPSGRNRQNRPCPAKARAIALGLPVATPEKINAPDAIAQLESWSPEAIVVVAYGQFLGRRLLALPPLGCVNIHLSLLPRHRGAAPVQWAIASGDTKTGVTAMLMNQIMDGGDILACIEEPILPTDTAGVLYDRLALLGGPLLVRTLNALAAGQAVRTPQDVAGVTVAPKLHKDDGWIDWKRSAHEIALRVRAWNPWPGSFTILPEHCHSKRIKVLQAEAIESPVKTGGASPGSVENCSADKVCIQTGNGLLQLITVQPENGKPMDARAFLCGHPLKIGDILGQRRS